MTLTLTALKRSNHLPSITTDLGPLFRSKAPILSANHESYIHPSIQAIPSQTVLKALATPTTMASSPSEFLTFYRTIRSTSTLRHAPRQCLARPAASRPFTTTLQQRKDMGPGRDHVLDKAHKGDDKTNIQSEQSKKGRE